MATWEITTEKHPMSTAATGPTFRGKDTAQVKVAPVGAKAMKDVVAGDFVMDGQGTPFKVLTSQEVV